MPVINLVLLCHNNLQCLGGYLLDEHFSHLSDESNPYLALFDEVVRQTAKLVAQWQGGGFCHGVMNSDNMSILGLTLDYGPFACLATALLPLIHDDGEIAIDLVRERFADYWSHFDAAYLAIVRAKLGLMSSESGDLELWNQLLGLLEGRVDYTNFFRDLGAISLSQPSGHPQREKFVDHEAFDRWINDCRQRLLHEESCDERRRDVMDTANPKYILRNYMVEVAIRKAEDEGDYSEIDRLLALLHKPYSEQPGMGAYAERPPLWAGKLQLSCSS